MGGSCCVCLPGSFRSEVSAAAFYPLSTRFDLTAGDSTGVELLLAPRSSFSSSGRRRGCSPPAAPPAAVAVAPAQVLRTPGALDNVFRTLQTLPGVSATEEFGSRLAVRGGAPDQNLTVMDGVEIHDPYRLFGLTSAFNPEIIQRFELSTGGFSVKHGDRLSSLLLVENRDGTRQRSLAGSASLSITDANVVLEGRLPRAANGSWLVTARRTYYDLVASRVADQEFPRFADVQGKGVWEVAPGRTLSVFGLRSRQAAALNIDDDDARGEFQDDTRNDLAWARFDASIGASAQSHTDRGLLEQHVDLRRRRRVQEPQRALQCSGRRCDRDRQRGVRSDAGRAGRVVAPGVRPGAGRARHRGRRRAASPVDRPVVPDSRRPQSRRRERVERAGRSGTARLAHLEPRRDPRADSGCWIGGRRRARCRWRSACAGGSQRPER